MSGVTGEGARTSDGRAPRRRPGTRLVLGLLGWIVLCYGAALIGAQFMPGEWYAGLEKPTWTPPDWLFGPVWTVLYGLMAVAAWLVWKEFGFRAASGSLVLFVGQLGLNAAWSWVFFGLNRPGLAFLHLVVLCVAVAGLVLIFWKRLRLAGGLLVPYLLWISFAAVLNFEIWRLNA
jgi:translocator protein